MSSKSGRTFAAVSAAAFACVTGAAWANQYNLQPPQSGIAHEIYDLHTLIMWIIVGIFVVVFGFMTVAIIKHRKSVGHQAQQFHDLNFAVLLNKGDLPGNMTIFNLTLLARIV